MVCVCVYSPIWGCPLGLTKKREVWHGLLRLVYVVAALKRRVLQFGFICLHAGVSWGLYFAAYNQAKQRWQRMGGEDQLSPVQHLLAAAEGGAVVCSQIGDDPNQNT